MFGKDRRFFFVIRKEGWSTSEQRHLVYRGCGLVDKPGRGEGGKGGRERGSGEQMGAKGKKQWGVLAKGPRGFILFLWATCTPPSLLNLNQQQQ